MRRWLGIPLLLFAAAGCSGGRQIVPLLDAAGVPLTPPTTATLEVVTRSTAVPDPLPVHGSDVAYTDVELALGHAVASATVPWAESHRTHPGGAGWQLFVEMTSADAEYDDGRAVFTLGVRATLAPAPATSTSLRRRRRASKAAWCRPTQALASCTAA